MELLTTYQFYFLVSRVEVGHVLVFLATIKREREDGDLHISVVLLLILNEKTDFLSLVCDLGWLLFHFDFGLDLSLDLRFWFYRSHLFSILRYPLSSSPAVGRVFWIHFGLVRFSLSSRDLSWFLAFLTLSASSGFLRQLLCLQCEFLLHASKGYRPESRPKLCLVARLPRCSRCSFLRFVWLPLVSSSSILSSTCSFLGRTDRVPSCSSSSSTSLLDLSVETLLPPRAGHPARSSSCCI
jgi:hypothetical protein